MGAAGVDVIEKELARIGRTPQPYDIVLLNTGASAQVGTPKYFTDFTGLDGEATDFLLDLGVRKLAGGSRWGVLAWTRAEEACGNRGP